MKIIKCVIAGVVGALLAAGAVCAAQEARYADGVYEGEHSFVKVSVTVDRGRIADVAIVSHGGGGQSYAALADPLCAVIVERQTTDFDAVTGATVTSEHLRKAVNAALAKAAT